MRALPYIVFNNLQKNRFMAPVCWLKSENMNPVS